MHLGVNSVLWRSHCRSERLRVPLASSVQALLRTEGGEQAGLRRLQQYVWASDAVAHYAETRNGMTTSPSVVRGIPESQQAVCLSTSTAVLLQFTPHGHDLSQGTASTA